MSFSEKGQESEGLQNDGYDGYVNALSRLSEASFKEFLASRIERTVSEEVLKGIRTRRDQAHSLVRLLAGQSNGNLVRLRKELNEFRPTIADGLPDVISVPKDTNETAVEMDASDPEKEKIVEKLSKLADASLAELELYSNIHSSRLLNGAPTTIRIRQFIHAWTSDPSKGGISGLRNFISGKRPGLLD